MKSHAWRGNYYRIFSAYGTLTSGYRSRRRAASV